MTKSKHTIIQDTRETTPWDFTNLCQVEKGSLDTGDYSLKGFEEYIRIERKSIDDFIGCLSNGTRRSDGTLTHYNRDRFKRELQRLKSYACKAVIIECNIQDIYEGNWRQYQKYLEKLRKYENGQGEKPRKTIEPSHAIGAINSWRNTYKIEFIYGGNRDLAVREALKLMTSWVENMKKFCKKFEGV